MRRRKRRRDLPEEERQGAFPQRAAAAGATGAAANFSHHRLPSGGRDGERSCQRLQRGSALTRHADLQREEGDASALVGDACRGQRSKEMG